MENFLLLTSEQFCVLPLEQSPRAVCMVLFVAQAHKNVSSTNSEDSKWSQKFILLLSRAVTLILARQLDPSLQSTEAQIHFQILKMSRRISTKISTT